MEDKETQDAVEIYTSIAVAVYFCETDFETKEEWKAFLNKLNKPSANRLLVDSVDLDDVKESIAQTTVYIRVNRVER